MLRVKSGFTLYWNIKILKNNSISFTKQVLPLKPFFTHFRPLTILFCILGKFSSTQQSQSTFVKQSSPMSVNVKRNAADCWPWLHLKYLFRRPSVGEFQLWCWGVAIGAPSWLEGWRELWRRGILSIIFHWDEIKSRELRESCDCSHPSLL